MVLPFPHDRESAEPGFYQVYLQRYGINAELTTTLHCGFHKYTFPKDEPCNLVVNLARSNERVNDWQIEQEGSNAFKGYQQTGERVYFYAVASQKITAIETQEKGKAKISVVSFDRSSETLEIKVALSFVSTGNAKMNMEAELKGRSFAEVRKEASQTWETLLAKINVTGGTEREKELFYSSLYRSFLWPALRSDVNGDFTDASGNVVNKRFRYYTNPSLWDTYRNKLVLLGLLSPEVTNDVICSLIDKGEKTGLCLLSFMATMLRLLLRVLT